MFGGKVIAQQQPQENQNWTSDKTAAVWKEIFQSLQHALT